jgi:myo-inositol 2-dehydrogenase / D-chiro-inositol 1-dehydrogenase
VIRLGLIGCGEHSERGHAIPLARYKADHPDEVTLAAACDLRVERALEFCGKYGFLAAYQSLDDLLMQESLDGCIAVMPPGKISEVGVKLLGLGIPCIVEKPLGSSLEEVSALQSFATASQTGNMVSVNRRFMPFLNRAIEWTRVTGSLRYVRCTLARHARTEPEFVWETAVHAVDALRYIVGDVVAVESRGLKSNEAASKWYSIDLQFEKGIAGRIDVLPTTGMLEENYEMFGDGFRASVTCPFGSRLGWHGFRDGRVVIEESANGEPEDIMNGCYDETAAFIRAVSTKSAPKPSIAAVAPSVILCMAIAERK